jgi:RNA polymerase sigma-70 factor, ECF subfamily
MQKLRHPEGPLPPSRPADASESDASGADASESLQEFAAGSLTRREWIEAMVDCYQRPLLAYACRLLGGDHARAQDAVQETFLRLCREDQVAIESRVAAWLFSVCRTRVIDLQRATGRAMNSIEQMPLIDARPDASMIAESAEQRSRLAMLVESLSPRQQEVIRLRLQAELSYREIAEITGMTVSNVGFHLHAAVRSLRESMNSV